MYSIVILSVKNENVDFALFFHIFLHRASLVESNVRLGIFM